ncbi:hypothetical protein MMAR_5580 [Mycobacterium marinum M]|uniref:Uncharacterized protein n=1 Tax=Mycobacterium marinum (strain ATCC BAA-535 / M) TaxID=216594 RepID=B2HE17_MYCMM|nr:hypothetical protein MMAR_5580 [Mycobacterium marinum M]
MALERGIPAGGAGITPVARRSAFSLPSLRRGRDVAAAEILFTVRGRASTINKRGLMRRVDLAKAGQ